VVTGADANDASVLYLHRLAAGPSCIARNGVSAGPCQRFDQAIIIDAFTAADEEALFVELRGQKGAVQRERGVLRAIVGVFHKAYCGVYALQEAFNRVVVVA
jgi:hypothetical protein